MAYSINQAYKDVEEVLNRPLGSMDFYDIGNWFNNYDADFIKICIDMCRGRQVFSTKYITSMMFKQYSFYQAVKSSFTNVALTEQAFVRVSKEETKEIEDDNMCKEVGWEGCTKDEQEYIIKLFAHTLYPEEHPKPDNPNGYNY